MCRAIEEMRNESLRVGMKHGMKKGMQQGMEKNSIAYVRNW